MVVFASLLALMSVGCPPVVTDPPPGSTGDPSDSQVPAVTLVTVASGLNAPIALAPFPDETGRMLLADQTGSVFVLDDNGVNLERPFLSVADRMVSLNPFYDERGLLGLALHPDFAANGRIFVYYSAPLDSGDASGFNHQSRISEFTVSSDNMTVADADSERVILEIPQPQSNHNGGHLVFGPDGMLYIGLGDGGGGGDRGLGHDPDLGNGQDRSTLLGTILRIDVDGDAPYAIPDNNPFVDAIETRDEIFALGLRNPWRFSFDRDTGELYVGDVGQGAFEEVSIVSAGDNLGWFIKEGNACFNPSANCPNVDAMGQPLVDPIIAYPHDASTGPTGSSVIGGYVYRGSDVPSMVGQYVFADFADGSGGRLYVGEDEGSEGWTVDDLPITNTANGRPDFNVLSLEQDAAGELYVLADDGRVYRIAADQS